MTVLIDVSGNTAQAESSLGRRGIQISASIGRSDLKPALLLKSLRRLRKTSPEACCIFCQQMRAQHNRFALKIIGLLSGAKEVFFCDDQEIGPPMTRSRLVFKEIPVFSCRCLYALLVVLGFSLTYALVALLVSLRLRLRSAVPGNERNARRLCYLKTDFWYDLKAGGSVTHTREFINAGSELGYAIEVFSPDPLVHYRLKPRVRVVRPATALYDFPILISQMEYNLRYALVVGRYLKRNRALGLYQRNSTNNFSGVLLSVVFRIPFILEFNSSSAWIAKHWNNARFYSLETLCEKLNLKGAYRVAVVSDELKKGLQAMGLDGAKVRVNPNCVDPARFGTQVDGSAVRSLFPADKQLIGFIGIFGQWHGVLTLMACVKHVIQAHRSAHFLIIGEGSLKEQMLQVLERDGVAQHVTFVGLIKHDKAPAYLKACDVLVSPHEDMSDGSVFFGSPTKIFEYMAMGKGIVASNVGQLGQILEHEVDAILVEQRKETQLAHGIVRLLRDRELRQRLGASARRKVVASYTWEKNFRRMVSELESCRESLPLPAAPIDSARPQAGVA